MRIHYFTLLLTLLFSMASPHLALSDESALFTANNIQKSTLQTDPFQISSLQTSAEPEFLPVDEAFKFFPEINNNTVKLYWEIADNYYLFKHRFNVKVSINNNEVALSPSFIGEEKIKYDEYAEEDVSVYYHTALIKFPLAPDSDKNTTTINLKVSYQGCADAGLCYPPQTKKLIINLATGEIVDAKSVSPSRSQPAQQKNSTLTNSTSTLQQDTSEINFFTAILLAILGGAILNLMPCVFPVLSMKALSFASASGDRPKQLRHAAVYSFGVIFSFTAIAAVLLILKAGGSAIGWGFQLQSPLIVSILVYVFFVMGLSLSGLVTFGTRMMGAGQSLTSTDDYKGSFFTGVLASVVASPCTAPFMAPALGFAVTQPPVMALAIFAAVGLGMALPFYLLAAFPALGKALPKPGPWMDTFKQLMAFPMYASAIWLLWVLGHQSSADGIIVISLGCLTLAMGFWLLGRRGPSHSKRRVAADITAILSFAFAIYVLFTSHIDNPSDSQTLGHNEAWEAYSPALLKQYRDKDQAVFIDLTADWCITCLINEKAALDKESVLTVMKEKNIAYIRGDWTNYNADITALLTEFNRSGVPLYILYPSDQSKPASLLPQLLTEEIVLSAFNNL